MSMEIYVHKCACFGYELYDYILHSDEFKTMK